MKKILFLLLLAFSIHASAQGQFLLYGKNHPGLNSLENTLERIGENGSINLSGLNGRNYWPTLKHQVSDQSTIIQVEDSIYRYIWDDLTLEWKSYDKTIDMVYNINNSVESLIHCWMYTDTTWYYDTKKIYTYDASYNLTSELIQLWEWNGYWYDFERHSYSYDVENNRVHTLWQITNTKGEVWENTIQLLYTRDFTNNNTSELHQTWTGTEWANDYFLTTTYDNDSKVISIVEQRWNEGVCEYVMKWDYAYDSDNNEISELNQIFRQPGVWTNNVLYTSAYDSENNRTSYLTQVWDSGYWKDFSRIYSVYDGKNNLIIELGENRDSNTWKNSFQRTYTYDTNNFLKSRCNKNWNKAATSIQSGDSTYHYFHTLTGISKNKDQTENVIVYPNPGKGVFRILSDSIISVKVYDILGKQVYSDSNVKQQKAIQIDLTGFGEGVYFVKVTNKQKSHIEKIIIN